MIFLPELRVFRYITVTIVFKRDHKAINVYIAPSTPLPNPLAPKLSPAPLITNRKLASCEVVGVRRLDDNLHLLFGPFNGPLKLAYCL